ncbi:MAG: DUF4339 domain-containing protein [Kiritimatiellae bacterium]|nr:DUF4339 domain-containing protein [Kiritimatiellia bacterium]
MANWYYVDPKTSDKRGPYDERRIRQGYIDGLLSAGILVWREGLANWVPLRDALDLTAAPPLGEGRVPLPAGLCAWMLFDGICTIIVSLPLLLLLPWNIPLLVAGIALLGARSTLERTPYVHEETLPFLLRLRTVFCAAGWVYIVMIVLAIVLFLAGVHLSFAALADTVSGSL